MNHLTKTRRLAMTAVVVLIGLLFAPTAARAEVIEEIVAWVNGEIITKSDYEEEERLRIAEVYRSFSGEELDEMVKKTREGLLLQLIDSKILVHHAQALGYDIDKMGVSCLETVKKQQNIESDEELIRLLEQDGMTLEGVKKKLVEMYAPEEVIRFEVTSRISVGDREVEAYYEARPDEFELQAEVNFREIVLRADGEDEKLKRRAEADAIRERALAGEDFAALATELSEAGTASSGGQLGPLKKDDLAERLAAAAFSLPVGEVSEVMEMPYGFHIIKVEGRVDQRLRSVDEVRDRLRSFLEDKKYRTELAAFLQKARNNSSWCVKPSYQHLVSIEAPTKCETPRVE